MVLGQLPTRRTASPPTLKKPNSNPNPNPNRGQFFLGAFIKLSVYFFCFPNFALNIILP